MKKIPYILIPLFVGVLTLTSLFAINGPFTSYPDTKVYVDQISYFKGEIAPDLDIQFRSFKPFYGVVGATLSRVMTPDLSILLINILFFFGLILATYCIIREVGFTELYAAIGASWVATGYPLLKYGLALLTDISGWFFAGAVVAVFLIGMRKDSTKLLLTASLIGFVGSLCKETGILGLGFAGLYLVLHFLRTRDISYLKKIIYITIPFIVLQALFLYELFTRSDTHISFLGWFLHNKEVVGGGLHTLYYFILTELSTFSLLWVYAFVGLYAAYRQRSVITTERWITAVCLVVTTLPPLVWPVFLTRILYIGYLAVIPLGLVGLQYWHSENTSKKKTFLFLSILPVLSSVILFSLAGGRSLFPLLERLL